MSARVILIGGAGFIGHHLALALAAAGDEVVVVDNLHTNHIGQLSANGSIPDR